MPAQFRKFTLSGGNAYKIRKYRRQRRSKDIVRIISPIGGNKKVGQDLGMVSSYLYPETGDASVQFQDTNRGTHKRYPQKFLKSRFYKGGSSTVGIHNRITALPSGEFITDTNGRHITYN